MKTRAGSLGIAALLAVATSVYGAGPNRRPSKPTTVPLVSAPVVPPTQAAIPPISPITPAPQVALPPTQTPIMPTAPVVMPTDPVTIQQPQGDAIQGTTPPQ